MFVSAISAMIVSCPGRSVSWLCVPVTTVLSDRETFVSCMFLYKIKCKMRLVYSFFFRLHCCSDAMYFARFNGDGNVSCQMM